MLVFFLHFIVTSAPALEFSLIQIHLFQKPADKQQATTEDYMDTILEKVNQIPVNCRKSMKRTMNLENKGW